MVDIDMSQVLRYRLSEPVIRVVERRVARVLSADIGTRLDTVTGFRIRVAGVAIDQLRASYPQMEQLR